MVFGHCGEVLRPTDSTLRRPFRRIADGFDYLVHHHIMGHLQSLDAEMRKLRDSLRFEVSAEDFALVFWAAAADRQCCHCAQTHKTWTHDRYDRSMCVSRGHRRGSDEPNAATQHSRSNILRADEAKMP